MTTPLTDDAVLSAVGQRLEQMRIRQGVTQAQLAAEAGVSRDTIIRLEAGRPVTSIALVRVCRVLGLLDQLDALLGSDGPSPLELVRGATSVRKRARRATPTVGPSGGGVGAPGGWTWGDER